MDEQELKTKVLGENPNMVRTHLGMMSQGKLMLVSQVIIIILMAGMWCFGWVCGKFNIPF